MAPQQTSAKPHPSSQDPVTFPECHCCSPGPVKAVLLERHTCVRLSSHQSASCPVTSRPSSGESPAALAQANPSPAH